MRKIIPLLFLLAACGTKETKTTGSIERLDPELDAILSADAKVEVIGNGFDWSEGPVFVDQYQMLLFSDVPRNTVYKWTEEKGIEEYLKPSGFTGSGNYSREPGSNGLLLDDEGNLLLCQHGDRRLAIMDADINAPQPVFTSIADNYQGKKFNSPNDCARDMNGNFYMTDPPYGLPNQENDTTRQTPWQGVYKIDANGKVSLLVDSITRPNGIALSPDNKFLYVANSDPAKAIWYRYQLGDSSVVAGSVFYDATADSKSGLPGLPDGFKVDGKGNLFASGPGGVSIFNSSGKLLGRIKLDAPTSNTALSGDEKTLYITNDSLVLRVKLRP